MPNFTGKSGGGPHKMKEYGKGKSPMMMTNKQKNNLPPELVAKIAKSEGSPLPMYGSKPHKKHAMKKYKK